MQTNARLVAHSKVMAHLFPNLIPPIDRTYTLRYLNVNGHANVQNGPEWLVMRQIISDFFIPIARNSKFQKQARQWMAQQGKYPWELPPIQDDRQLDNWGALV
jgi:hypothetical protein